MTAARPTAQTLFALYHLGLDDSGVYKFRNMAECARHCAVSVEALQAWLRHDRIDSDVVKTVPFNLTKLHVDAQFVAPEDSAALVERAFGEFRAAQQRFAGSSDKFVHDVNYDDIWGDGHNGLGEKS